MGVQAAPADQAVSGVHSGISTQLLLTVLNVRQQVSQEHPNPGGLLGVPRSVEGKHRETSTDLFQGQQGTLKNLTDKGSSECFGKSILVSLNLDNTQGHSNYNSKHQYFTLK